MSAWLAPLLVASIGAAADGDGPDRRIGPRNGTSGSGASVFGWTDG